VTLRCAGAIEQGETGIALLREAVEVLEPSPCRLEHAHALLELGAALRRSNQRADARGYLRPALEMAHQCGATPLAQRAQRELAATGARPRRVALSGIDALTASERRVAELAAGGLSNPEIAQQLFVTRKTIETHLAHAYQKLSISSRRQLPDALGRPMTGLGFQATDMPDYKTQHSFYDPWTRHAPDRGRRRS
jgi:DNA-binding CsgD family transcriptional regulator